MTSPAMRTRYLSDSITTASPARLLVMLYDRLVLDLTRAETAMRASDREEASSRLLHAQEITLELRVSLDMTSWSGSTGLADLYTFLLSELIAANINRDAERVASCLAIVEPLRDAWQQAAASVRGSELAASRKG